MGNGALEGSTSELQEGEVAELLIEDMQGRTIHLAYRGPEEWVLPIADDYPIIDVYADQLIEDMVELDNARPVTQTEASHDRLMVGTEMYERKVTATMANGATDVLYVGTTPVSRATHVREEGDDNVYISNDLTHREVSTQVIRWVDPVIYSVNQRRIRSFVLTNANGSFEFDRDEEDNWHMRGLEEGETFNPNNLISLVTTVSSISLTQPLGREEKPEYGMLLPQATIVLGEETDDVVSPVTIVIGADTETANRVVLKTSESPWFVEVNRFTVERLIERTREDFLVQPPADAPEPASEQE